MTATLDQVALERLRAQDRADCPIAYFSVEKRPSQRPFFYDEHPTCFLFCGMRAGKTTILVARTAMAMAGVEPLNLPGSLKLLPKPPVKVRHWCTDLTKAGENVILPMYLGLLPPSLLDKRNGTDGYNRSKHTLRLTNGSFMELMSYEMPGTKTGMAERDIVNLDEAPREELYESQYARILTTGGFIWGAMTLDEVRTTWPIWWIDRRILRKGDGEDVVNHHYLSTEENVMALAEEAETPVLRQRILSRLAALKTALSKSALDVMLHGKAGWLEGVVYREFDEDVHTYQPKLQPNDFLELARKGYGRVWCGMDFGGSHPTVCLYTFICMKAVPELQLLEGDYVQIGEYFLDKGGNALRHIAKMKPIHDRVRPAGYVCDTQMWDRDVQRGGPRVSDMFRQAGIRPLYKARKPIPAGVERVHELLACRPAPYGWPRYRLLRGRNPHTVDGFKGWQYHANAHSLSGADKYSEYNKDQMDALRYLCMRCVERGRTGPIVQMPLDPISGLPLSLTVPGAWVNATR